MTAPDRIDSLLEQALADGGRIPADVSADERAALVGGTLGRVLGYESKVTA